MITRCAFCAEIAATAAVATPFGHSAAPDWDDDPEGRYTWSTMALKG